MDNSDGLRKPISGTENANLELCRRECSRLAELLYQNRQRLNFAEQIARLGYWELNLSTKRFYWSAQMFRIFGYSPQADLARRNLIREGILPQDMPVYKQKLRQLLQTGQAVEGRIRLRRPDGTMAYCAFRAGLAKQGVAKRIAGTFQDISDTVRQEQILAAAIRAKNYFLAQASHDLRQPMQAMQLFIQTLAEEPLAPQHLQLVKKIAAAADNLKHLLDNMLDISKLDSGGFRVEKQNLDIGIILCKLCIEYHQTTAVRKLELICRVRHFTMFGDSVLIERLVRNLFSNALKYSQSKILLSCQKEQDRAKIRVIDNGIGISLQEQQKIFEEFYQSPDFADNRSIGAGLGLNIVRRIADLLGAQIRVRSRLGKYTAFEISVPLQ